MNRSHTKGLKQASREAGSCESSSVLRAPSTETLLYITVILADTAGDNARSASHCAL